MSSELVVDKLTGRGTSGVITVTLENSESQILQQGLAKVTANILVDGTSNADASLKHGTG